MKDKITIDMSDDGKAYDERGFKPEGIDDLIDYMSEMPITTREAAVVGRMADLRGDSTGMMLDPRHALILGDKNWIASKIRNKKKKVTTGSGHQVEVRAYDMPAEGERCIEEGEPDGNGVYEKTIASTPDECKSLITIEDDKAIASAENYVRTQAMGAVKDRIYRLSALGHREKALELCDWLTEQVANLKSEV